jgi:hypothetical protein
MSRKQAKNSISNSVAAAESDKWNCLHTIQDLSTKQQRIEEEMQKLALEKEKILQMKKEKTDLSNRLNIRLMDLKERQGKAVDEENSANHTLNLKLSQHTEIQKRSVFLKEMLLNAQNDQKESRVEISLGEDLCKKIEERILQINQENEKLMPAIAMNENELANLQNQLAAAKMAALSSGDFSHNEDAKLAALKSENEILKSQLCHVVDSEKNFKSQLDDMRNKSNRIDPDLSLIGNKIESGKADLVQNAQLEKECRDIQEKIKVVCHDTENDSEELQSLKSELANLKIELKETWNNMKNDSTIQSQLRSEADAVLRAETVIGMQQHQKHIRRETEEMASIKTKDHPHLAMDDEANDTLLWEHRKRGKIPQTIIDMTLKEHIV